MKQIHLLIPASGLAPSEIKQVCRGLEELWEQLGKRARKQLQITVVVDVDTRLTPNQREMLSRLHVGYKDASAVEAEQPGALQLVVLASARLVSEWSARAATNAWPVLVFTANAQPAWLDTPSIWCVRTGENALGQTLAETLTMLIQDPGSLEHLARMASKDSSLEQPMPAPRQIRTPYGSPTPQRVHGIH